VVARAGEGIDVLRQAGEDHDGPGGGASGSGLTGAGPHAADPPGATASHGLAHPLNRRSRLVFGIAGALVVALVVSLIVRPIGSYVTPVDGWGVDALELTMGALCVARYFEGSWRASTSVVRVFPLVIGVACISWGVGSVVLTMESLGGAPPPVPSTADAFHFLFFPLCFIAFALLIRRGNQGSLVQTSLDGLVAAFAAAAFSATFVVAEVIRVTGGSSLAVATHLVYPLADVLLLALAVGGLAVLPRAFRPFFALVCVALASNAIGAGFNLLHPASRFGYVSNGAAWPVSLTLLAVAVWLIPSDVEYPGTDRSAGFALPAFGALVGMAILLTASFGTVGKPAIALATMTLLVAGVRLGLTVREAHAMRTARFRSLIDKTWDLITVTEADLRIAYITPSAERVLGYSQAELEGKPFTEFVHPDDSHLVIEHLTGLTADASSAVFEVRMRHASGAWRLIDWNAADLLEDQSVNGYVLNGGDVTEARQAAEDLVAARDAALVASKAKSQFVSMMSHEIRTPMNGVIGLTELLLQTDLDGEQVELAAGVKVSAESLLVIINDILDFSKMEAGRLDIEESDLDLRGVVEDVGRILAGTAHGKGVELIIDIPPDVPSDLLGDATRIRQVLVNFGANAVKFTNEGEVVIRVTVLHQNAERVALHFDVVDTGIGIAEEDQERLFMAFAQADSSTTRRFGGTGLGLTICRQLVELMGGRLGLVSEPRSGSTFWFELSLRRSNEAPPAESGGDPRTLSGQRALVVDDNATNRRILRQQLLSWGVEAVEAADGDEALEVAAKAANDGRTFDLGIVDLNMPGMDGIELARALKDDASTAGTMLFLLSSSGYHLEAAESHLNGFAASLTKPVRSSELFDCLITSLNAGSTAETPDAPATARADAPGPEVRGTILLVEDNKVNQLVGCKVLENLGYHYDIAMNGLEAVSLFGSHEYDAILMDCQMPEMDGYEATEEIRRREDSISGGGTRHIPIIAMTAAAMEGDRERCMAAGMDDFITKPVRLEAIGAVLERWVTQAPDAQEAAATAGAKGPGVKGAAVVPGDAGTDGADRGAAVPTARAGDPLDHAQIELLLSLDDGRGAALAEIVDEYVRVASEGLAELLREIDEHDSGGLARTAHTLKGASANVGASGMAQVCAGLELRARQARLDDAAVLMQQFEAEFARVQVALQVVAEGS
jgi:two-component system sensor histidine kinase/response regulator